MGKRLLIFTVFVLAFLLFAQAAFASGIYLVQPGDTLWSISQRYNTTVSALAGENNLSDPGYIEVGQRLVVPGAEQTVHIVSRGETLWQISRNFNVTVDAIARENQLTDINLIEIGDRLVIPKAEEMPAEVSIQAASRGGRTFSASELELFARLVHSEAAGEPYLGQVAVAASVLNRVDSSRYPNTLSGVINQVVNGFYQYSPVLDGRINIPASESARRAVSDAINGSDPSLGATGFYNPRKTSNQWVRQQPVTTVIANHVFFR
ncbi:MAG: LysM peptidoglycan-binding domain-containing protein [Dethiobacter sp.]|jgi:N-acetylmuramoyl-L-alanine amidase|nr:LysM peptidoglycan-binding domain-containing protein [Dethiobacter sp.]